MSDALALALAVVVLALTECAVWARHGAVVFVAPWWWGPERARPLARALGGAQGAFSPLNPLPPFGRAYVAEPWPFSAGDDGVVAFCAFALGNAPRPAQSGRFLAWADVKRVRAEDRDVLVDGEVFVSTSSARHARAAARALEALRRALPAERSALLDELLAAHLDPARPRDLIARHRRAGRLPAAGAHGVFLAIFIGAPLSYVLVGLANWPWLVLVLALGLVTTAAGTWLAYRSLMPDEKLDRWMQSLLMFVAPTLALRANDKLGRHLLAGAHPLAVTLASATSRGPHSDVALVLRDLSTPRLPLLADANPLATSVETEFRARLLAQARRVCRTEGVDVDACLAPPVLRASETAFCPRCRVPYRAAGVCSDCGVALCTSPDVGAPASAERGPPPRAGESHA